MHPIEFRIGARIVSRHRKRESGKFGMVACLPEARKNILPDDINILRDDNSRETTAITSVECLLSLIRSTGGGDCRDVYYRRSFSVTTANFGRNSPRFELIITNINYSDGAVTVSTETPEMAASFTRRVN